MELARPECPPPQASIVKGKAEHSDKHEENMFTRGGAVGAGARHGGGNVDGVHVSGGA